MSATMNTSAPPSGVRARSSLMARRSSTVHLAPPSEEKTAPLVLSAAWEVNRALDCVAFLCLNSNHSQLSCTRDEVVEWWSDRVIA